MGFDFFTIHNLAAELAPRLESRRIGQAGSAAAELGLSCGPEEHLYARMGREGWVCLRPGPLPAALAGTAGPERYLRGARVERVWADRRERLLCLRLSRPDRSGAATYGQLIFELIHPHFQVVLLSEKRNQVLGLWGAGQRLEVGQSYLPPPGPRRLVPGEDGFEAFAAALGRSQGRLDRVLAGMDAVVAAHLLQRAGLPPQAENLDQGALRRVWEAAVELYGRPPQMQGYLWREAGQCRFCGLEPASAGWARLPSISQAIVRAHEEESAGQGDLPQLEKQLRRGLRLLQRRRQAIAADLAEAAQAEQLQRQGNTLLACLAAVKPGAGRVELPDIYDPSGQGRISLELDPRRTPAENGQRLLRMARKYCRRREVLPGRLRSTEEEIARVEGWLRGEEMRRGEAEKWLAVQGLARPEKQRGPREETAHPRRYRTAEGWSVWAGRNNRENDLLTHRLAAQNDLWFHAHGYPGAHVVLRREGRREEPSGQTLREAASLAAYWSKGKTARKVPVVYTLVKFVSKPRGGAPGQALIRREKTLVVEPQLLPEEEA